ncbi:hypothetical protein CR513_10320, partial [Mucuna pruriens]
MANSSFNLEDLSSKSRLMVEYMKNMNAKIRSWSKKQEKEEEKNSKRYIRDMKRASIESWEELKQEIRESKKGELVVNKQVNIELTLGKYKDEILCDVVPMEATHILVGRPWQFDRQVTYDDVANLFSFIHKDKKLLKECLRSSRTSFKKCPKDFYPFEGLKIKLILYLVLPWLIILLTSPILRNLKSYKDRYPIPRLDDLLDKLYGTKVEQYTKKVDKGKVQKGFKEGDVYM